MIKTMLALLLIVGIILAASLDVASGNENGAREHAGGARLVPETFGQYLAARSFADVPWLDHAVSSKTRNDGAIMPKLDTLDPFRLQLSDAPAEATAVRSRHNSVRWKEMMSGRSVMGDQGRDPVAHPPIDKLKADIAQIEEAVARLRAEGHINTDAERHLKQETHPSSLTFGRPPQSPGSFKSGPTRRLGDDDDQAARRAHQGPQGQS